MEEVTYALETLRDCGDSPGMYEDGKIALEHAATVQAELQRLYEQLEAERRDEWREGIVNVLDHEGNYLGCMGSETWAWTLDGGIKRMKEQLESAREALHRCREDYHAKVLALQKKATDETLPRDDETAGEWAQRMSETSNPASEPEAS